MISIKIEVELENGDMNPAMFVAPNDAMERAALRALVAEWRKHDL